MGGSVLRAPVLAVPDGRGGRSEAAGGGVYADAVNGKHERLGSTPSAHRKAPEIKAVWARSGAWPPRAQTERARSLSPVVVDHDAGTLGQPKTQL
jgi:hypothetical protein